MSGIHAGVGMGGPIRYPEVDVAHMRWLRERKGMIVRNIAAEFDHEYSERYITQVIRYEVRQHIKPRNRDAD